jgi:predicted deacetylase
MIRAGIKPILAVIPDNKNAEFSVAEKNPAFWDEMKELELKGWTIALHGYDHVYSTKKAGILGITPRSEFAGVPSALQEDKIKNGLNIFKLHGITSRVWVAPAHSFDKSTIKILKTNGIEIISDGLSDKPYKRFNMIWIPCQLWDFSVPKKEGIYTVCIHLFKMNDDEIDKLCTKIELNKDIIVDLDYAMNNLKGSGFKDKIISILKSQRRKIKTFLR